MVVFLCKLGFREVEYYSKIANKNISFYKFEVLSENFKSMEVYLKTIA